MMQTPNSRTATGDVHLRKGEPFIEASGDTVVFGRQLISKVFRGDLVGESVGEMLSASSASGSAGYVAMERVVGTLHGRSGSFVLQHFGIMGPSGRKLLLEVVPDSGAGQLASLDGHMTITIDGGVHRYELKYTI